MKLWKSCMVVLGISAFILSTMTASAATLDDDTGDVYYWTGTGTAWSWTQNTVRDNVDIDEISTAVNGDKITITMTMVGPVQDTEKIWYYFYYNTSDTNYICWWINGTGFGMFSMGGGGVGSSGFGNVTKEGNTITAVFDIVGSTEEAELWGWAYELTDLEDTVYNEWWSDWAPNEKAPNVPGTDVTDGNGNNQNKGTPGFEAVAVIAAIGVAFILLKRRK